MKKKDIEKLDKWEFDIDREYDFIYVVPTRIKAEGYNMAYYIGKIGEEYKIIHLYDCGSLYQQSDNNFIINFDFEDIFGGVKFWKNNGKLQYDYLGKIIIK